MSYILDALRRLEQDKEKARKPASALRAVVQGGTREETGRRPAPVRWRIWLPLGLLCLLLLVGGTFWLARTTAPAQRQAAGPSPGLVAGPVPAAPAAPPRLASGGPAGAPRAAAAAPTVEPPRPAVPAPPAAALPPVPPPESVPAAGVPEGVLGAAPVSLQAPAPPVPRVGSGAPSSPDMPVEPAASAARSLQAALPRTAPAPPASALPPIAFPETVPEPEEVPEPVPEPEEVPEPVSSLWPPEPPSPRVESGADAAAGETIPPRLSGRETGIRICAIVWSPKREKRFAIVNLKTVYVGDSVEDSEVVEIREDEVVFERDGERFSVGMRER